MLKVFLVPFLTVGAFVALTSPAGGGATPDVTLSQKQAEPLIVNRSDLAVTARALDGDALEVSVIADLHGNAEAVTMAFLLSSDSEIAFSLPGQPELIYSFAREADRVVVDVTDVPFLQVAQID